jgi:hypothetical protein
MKFWIAIGFLAFGATLPGASATDSTRWKNFKSIIGFTIQIPDSWTVDSADESDNPPEKAWEIKIEGPKNADRKVRIHISERGPDELGGLTPKDFARLHIGDKVTELIDEGPFRLGGELGYQVTVYDHRIGVPSTVDRCIDVGHGRKQYELCVGEVGKGADQVYTPKDWKYGKEIDQVIASFKFTK